MIKKRLAVLFCLLLWPSAGHSQFFPPGLCESLGAVHDGTGCRCPDGSLAGMNSPCRQAPTCPAGTTYCAHVNLCCGAGNYCSTSGCIPHGAVDCGGGHHCPSGNICWTAPADVSGIRRGELRCATPERIAHLEKLIDEQRKREAEAKRLADERQRAEIEQRRVATEKFKAQEQDRKQALKRELEQKLKDAEAKKEAAAAKAAADKAAAMKAAADKVAADKAAAAKAAADKIAAAEKAKADKVEAIRKEVTQRRLAADAQLARLSLDELQRRFGQAIDPKTVAQVTPYALISQNVYGAGASYSPLPAGVRRVAEWDAILQRGGYSTQKIQALRSSGFYAAVYRNDKTGEITIAYRGTDQLRDLVGADLNARVGILDPQFKGAVDLARMTKNTWKQAPSVSLTGHSLGGALATYAGEQTGLSDVVTFNAARNKFSTGTSPKQINVVVPGEVIGDANTGWTIVGSQGLPGRTYSVRSTTDPPGVIGDFWGAHSMQGIIGGLADVR
jgi:Protein of unknown function (DUF2974)